jgi:hypothetical protein
MWQKFLSNLSYSKEIEVYFNNKWDLSKAVFRIRRKSMFLGLPDSGSFLLHKKFLNLISTHL